MNYSSSRFEVVAQLLKSIRADSLLDLGCSDGESDHGDGEMARIVGVREIYRVDVNDEVLRRATCSTPRLTEKAVNEKPLSQAPG